MKATLPILLGVYCIAATSSAVAQLKGEENEPTPEYRDAAFTSADAERVAVGFSDAMVPIHSPNDIGTMTEAADLVILGTVRSQSIVYDESGAPSTSTTFTITDKLKGAYRSDRITLLQPGGPSQSDSNIVTMVSDARYFALGEKELLFVEGSSNNAVHPEQTVLLSRYRIYENKLYNEDGFGFKLIPTDNGAQRLVQSRERNSAERFSGFNLGQHRMTKHFGDESKGASRASRTTQSIGLDVDTMSALIRARR